MARLGLIDRLSLKRAPFVAGSGTALFGTGAVAPELSHLTTTDHGQGIIHQMFDIVGP